ncbi:MAG: helicase C-terminal domain-containing protein [Curtobacterium sp.]
MSIQTATETTAAPPADEQEPHARDFLLSYVREATGAPDAQPRPGQAAAFDAAAAALEARTHFAGSLPTGSGKSAIALAAAAHRAHAHGERTIISTESLSLLSQIVDKDGPTMSRACERIGVAPVRVAAHMGVGNYLDPRRLFDTANLLSGTEDVWDTAALRTSVGAARAVPAAIDGTDVDLDRLVALVTWGLSEYEDDDATGSRHAYDGDHTSAEWSLVSAPSKTLAAKGDDTPYLPKLLQARALASEADIVVTNHTLLAIQATTGLPVVSGSAAIGEFENIVIDEAHALAGEVRDRGAKEVSGRQVHSLIRAVEHVADGAKVSSWAAGGRALADRLEQLLASKLDRGGKPVRLGQWDDPLDSLGDYLEAWIGQAPALVRNASKSPVTSVQWRAIRATERAEELAAAVMAVREHRVGQARWVQADDRPNAAVRWSSAQVSPVEVAGMIRRNLCERTAAVEGDDPVPLGVILMSASLPDGFRYEVGADAPVIEYPSPFDAAFANSALYIPAVTTVTADHDIPALTSDRYGSVKFDTNKHTAWAAAQIVDLVAARGGSALVLAAKAESGKEYVAALRDDLDPSIEVLSQWDGATPASLLQRWREDVTSVLVGTRSLMTGVDAPGQTCSLVILDRIPRSPSNPADDARVEALQERIQCDRWAADRLVYVADAALLEKQAVGRLIRSSSDSGMVAVLDPRLVRTQVGIRAGIAYPEATRQMYSKPLRSFPNLVHDLDSATAWLRSNRAAATPIVDVE